MFYLFQIGTPMLIFVCLYFIEIFSFIFYQAFNLPQNLPEQLFVFIFSILLLLSFCGIMLYSKFRKKRKNTENVFHPTSTQRQRVMLLLFLTITLCCIFCCILTLIIENFSRIAFIIINSISILSIIFSFLYSLFFESLPDKNDTLHFDKDFLYYYMRVQKGNKNNKSMNSYIIPYDAIRRSYIVKNKLYIEIDKNHPNLTIRRQFSTFSKRITINFLDYPDLKKFILQKEIQTKISLKDIANIELSDFFL